MIKYYDPNMCNAIHTVRITLMQEDYVGHISRKIKGDCKGADLLEADCFEYDDQDDIDRYVENDCKFSYDEDYCIYTAVLTNSDGDQLEVEGDTYEMKNMVVSIEFAEVEELITNETLKSCPFCGRSAVLKTKVSESETRYYVMCGKCESKSRTFVLAEEAVKSWNTRHEIDK